MLSAYGISANSTAADRQSTNTPQQDIDLHAKMANPVINKDKKSVPIVVPEQVSKKWLNVVIAVTNKPRNSETKQTYKIGGEGNIKGTSMVLEIKEFLPHFVMDAKGITSETNELKNPAVRVVIKEKNKIIYTGWVFKNHPSVPLFIHDTIDIKLKKANSR